MKRRHKVIALKWWQGTVCDNEREEGKEMILCNFSQKKDAVAWVDRRYESKLRELTRRAKKGQIDPRVEPYTSGDSRVISFWKKIEGGDKGYWIKVHFYARRKTFRLRLTV